MSILSNIAWSKYDLYLESRSNIDHYTQVFVMMQTLGTAMLFVFLTLIVIKRMYLTKKMLKINEKILRLFSALLLFALLLGCSNINLTNPKWTCEDNKNEPTCNVVFSAINKSDEPVSTAILIRAYHRIGKGKGAISNVLIGEKIIKIILLPNEQLLLNKTLTMNGPVSMIVATVINDK